MSVTDIHGGATADELGGVYADVAATLAADCARLALRPAGISIHAGFGHWSAGVYLPSADVPGVDALGGAYGLAVTPDAPDGLYERHGDVVLDGHPVTVSVWTTRPENPQPASALAVAATREVAPIRPTAKVRSERAEARPALALVGGAR